MRYLPKNAPPGSVSFRMLIAVQGWGASEITTDKGEWYSPEEFANEVPKWIEQLQKYAVRAREIAGKMTQSGVLQVGSGTYLASIVVNAAPRMLATIAAHEATIEGLKKYIRERD